MKKIIMSKDKYILIFILAFAFGIRLVNLDQSFWLDEATTGLVSRFSGLKEYIDKFAVGDFHPPVYYLTTIYWSKIFGSSEVSLRLISVVASVFTIYVVYKISLFVGDRKVALFSSIFLATSSLGIYYSQEARMYMLTTLWVSLCVYYFLKISYEKKSLINWLMLSVFLSLSIFTLYVCVFIIFALFASALILGWRKNKLAKLVCFSSLSLLPFIYWSKVLISQLKVAEVVKFSGSLWWGVLGKTTIKELLLVPTKFMLGRVSIENNLLFGLIIAIVGVVFLFIFSKVNFREEKVKLIITIFFLPILIVAVVGIKYSIFSYFRLLFLLPYFYILLSLGLRNIKKKLQPIIIATLLLVNIASSSCYLLIMQFHRENWRDFVHMVLLYPNSKIIMGSGMQTEAINYYGGRSYVSEPEKIDESINQIFFVNYLADIFDSEGKRLSSIQKLGFSKIKEYNFNGVVVYEYQK